MTTLLAETGADLLDRIADARTRAGTLNTGVLLAVSAPAATPDPLAWFARAAALTTDRFYWQAPDGLTLVGAGVAREFVGGGAARFAQVDAAWRALLATAVLEPAAAPRLFGGFAFDPDRPATGAWAGFPAGRMVLPRFLLTVERGEATITTALIVGPDTDARAEAARLEREHAALSATLTPGSPVAAPTGQPRVMDARPADDWQATVAALTGEIQAGALEKAVLAREVRVDLPAEQDPAGVLARLRAGYPDCFVFAVARGARCFLGATPERLVRLRAGEVQATCLAGSTRRATDPDEDGRLGAALLQSDKDCGEHEVVVRMLSQSLAPLCIDIQMPAAPRLLRLRNVQHLFTPITGRLRNGARLLDLVARLHPTPAVGGYPRAAALARIRALEGLDRGWYAGPVGWIDAAGDGEFAVAIRSALLAGRVAHAFAGCGIVAASDPAAEYAETQVKLRAILAALEAAPA
jgi:isochorismate synthase